MAELWASWFREALHASISHVNVLKQPTHEPGSEEVVPDDPGQDPRFRKLAESVLFGREVVATYNLVVFGAVLIFTAWYWGERLALRRATRACKKTKNEESANGAWSPSSSTIERDSNGLNNRAKAISDRDETSPLLPSSSSQQRPHRFWKPYHLFKACLQYQPRGIPIVNRNLPPNSTSLLVLSYLVLNAVYNFYGMTYELMYVFSFADRCGLVFAANLPLLYLLAAKNQPLKFLTGYSYESLNILHRRVGELMCFEAFLHFTGMFVVWYGVLRKIGFTLARFIFNRLVILGLFAFVSYQVLYFTSLRSFRQRMYELFLALHIFFQIAGLAFLWFHYHTSRPYVGVSIAIFVLDRLIFRLWLKSTTHPAILTVFDDNETVLVSANWDIVKKRSALACQSIKCGWKPNDHVFLTIPALSRKHAFQAHPFTIFSAAPTVATDGEGAHAWLSILIRAQGKEENPSFTRHLLAYARSHSRVNIRLDGPYGSFHALNMTRCSDTTVIVAGGSGIAVAYPLLHALLDPLSRDVESGAMKGVGRKVRLLWITHEAAHRSWIPVDKWEELLSWGLEAYTPPPTSVAGRPDVPSFLKGAIGGGRTGVVVSGPDGLVRDVRNTCAKLIGGGADVRVQVEKFGW